MPRHSYRCPSCGTGFDAIVAWDEYQTACACGAQADRFYVGQAQVIDDTLPGGPRYIHNMSDTPIWIATKTEYRAELAKRGLVQVERNNYSKDDRSPWATRTRLRPGAVDPFMEVTR